MTIPKPSQTKEPILKYLAKAGKPVKKAAITESIGKHFKLTKKEMEETSLRGSKRVAMSIIAATKEMKEAGLVKSSRHGYLAITAKGRTGLKAGTVTDGRKLGRPPKSQTARQSSITSTKQNDKTAQRTTEIVASYVGKKAVSARQLPGLIESVYATLQGLGSSSAPSRKTVSKRKYTKRKKIAKKKA